MRLLAATLLAALASAAPAVAAPQLVPVGSFEQPVHVAAPPGDPDLYVVEQRGRVYVLDQGQQHLFLNTEATTLHGGEQGLLSIAFHPQHASNGLLYVYESLDDGDDADADAQAVVEYRRDPANPLRALPESRRVAMSIPHVEQDNHNGGQLQFGPDGKLWVSVGDGGTQGDPDNDARTLSSPLGKLLSFDPTAPAPAGFGVTHFGLRNPWRFSFDRQTGDLIVGDVGGSIAEEVTFVPAGTGAGVDFGWNCVEGDHHHATRCPVPAAMRAPSIVLRHTNTEGDNYSSVIAGYVVRDPQVPSLAGRFVYSDLSHDRIRAATLPAATDDGDTELAVAAPLSFGEDACGRIYVAEAGGTVSRIEEQQPSLCAPGTQPPPGPGPGPGGEPADTRPCAVVVRGRRQRLARRLRLSVESDERCTLAISARVRRVARFRPKTLAVDAGERVSVRLGLRRKQARRLRRALRLRGALRVRVAVAARDAAGNQSAASKRIRLRR